MSLFNAGVQHQIITNQLLGNLTTQAGSASQGANLTVDIIDNETINSNAQFTSGGGGKKGGNTEGSGPRSKIKLFDGAPKLPPITSWYGKVWYFLNGRTEGRLRYDLEGNAIGLAYITGEPPPVDLKGGLSLFKGIYTSVRSIRNLFKAAKGVSVIGPRAIYRQFAKDIGANFLNVTDDAWTWAKNERFLAGVVKRGDDVVFAGKFNPAKLDPNSVLAREIKYLTERGYQWIDDFSRLIKK
ncbi:MAG TPA: hypothetical protein VFN30_15275 [Chitinophagaceae bacterium]|nr:hypothetical protein [Chitinophagaceae bacterium]